MNTQRRRHVAVVGGGWAGLAAAVEATAAGHSVTLFEMAGQLGGRARQIGGDSGDSPAVDTAAVESAAGAPAESFVSPAAGDVAEQAHGSTALPGSAFVSSAGLTLDNGQHILIGAYRATLALLVRVGIDPEQAFLRLPLTLRYADGTGLQLGSGPVALAFARAVVTRRGWSWGERLAMLMAAAYWNARRFRCPADWTVDQLTRHLPAAVRRDLTEPLCVAALNTPATAASAAVFLRVLHDALLGGRGSADLLLPRLRLGELLPFPAERWLRAAGAVIRLRRRVDALEQAADCWNVDGERFEAVILACSAAEAARLAGGIAPPWAQAAARLVHEPIVTVYVQLSGAHRLSAPMLLLHSDHESGPAQFVFDLGQLGGRPGLLAFVVSGAARWVEAGSEALRSAVATQARRELALPAAATLGVVRVVTEKRATFRCTPGLLRPPRAIAPGLHAAGDYVCGPYPATLEGAVRSGISAAQAIV